MLGTRVNVLPTLTSVEDEGVKFLELQQLKTQVLDALEERKGHDIRVLDVREMASFTDLMIIVTGQSTRQVKALADRVVEVCKALGIRPIGIEGEREAEWILVDLGDVVVHIMLPNIRDFYSLDTLWSVPELQPSRQSYPHH
jgi:ribosome-associated protein